MALGGVWSAHLAAMMFSVLQTIVLWGLNPHHWLHAFLQACADHGGKSPDGPQCVSALADDARTPSGVDAAGATDVDTPRGPGRP